MSGHVPVESFRSRIESIAGGLSIVMPARRSLVVTAVIGAWLVFWALSLLGRLPSSHLQGPRPPAAFLVIGCIAAVFAVAALLWTLVGQERVTIDTDTFAIRREVFGIGLARRYALSSVRALRVVDDAITNTTFGVGRGDPFGLRSGSLAFDYGAKTIRFGSGVDPAEAKNILSRVIAAKPALASST